MLHRFLLIMALACTAIACYIAGNASGTVTFIVMGVCVELLFWLQLLPTKRVEPES